MWSNNNIIIIIIIIIKKINEQNLHNCIEND